ncbi:nonstructural protein [robinz microvirus RP_96]|nr:nonstructural protein [robinz microvirus RP_96]
MAIFDVQAQAFHRPMFVQSRGVGLRATADEVNRATSDNLLYQHPEDFRLFELGEFDDATGLFSCHTLPALVADANSLKLER